MSVGVQREACRKMSQHARHGLDVHSILQSQRCEGVAQVRQMFINTKTERYKKPGSHRKKEFL